MDNSRTLIFLASDHNGNAARAYVKKVLEKRSDVEVRDLGPQENEGKVDYVDYAVALCQWLLYEEKNGRKVFGVLICGTGTGMSIVANRFRGIRAGIATDRATAELMREHNNANVLVLGQWRNSLSDMDVMVHSFLDTPHLGGRHTPRLQKLELI
jgi:ribose 5-phosphate isomerase B